MVESPCINYCKYDAEHGFCLGCYRTLEEISIWTRISDDEKSDILSFCYERKQKFLILKKKTRIKTKK